jgi:DNA polymerase
VTDDGAVRTPALPTLHPAFLLRQPQAKRMVWGDLLALGAKLASPNSPE